MTSKLKTISGADWPEPVLVLNEDGQSDIVFLCEHASNHLPAEYRRLGLDIHHLGRHIAWDIGAAELTHHLSTIFDAPAFLGTYSRLLIDLNRPLGTYGSIPARSEDTDIPGNTAISEAEKARRAARLFTPYHDRVRAHLDRRQKEKRPTRIVTVHSFTPVFQGISRPWHAGVLYDEARDFGEAIIKGLRQDPALNVDAQVPYVVSPDSDYAIPVHGDARGIPAVLIEIRQDLLSSREDAERWAWRLAAAIPAREPEAIS